jgi:chorismate synthase
VLRFLTAGESHGRGLVVTVEGLPAKLPVTVEAVADELARRRLGFGRGPRMRFERDELVLLGGVRHGRTLGSPVAITIGNAEWERSDKWHEEMSPAPGATKAPLTAPRPGHADLAGMQKFGFDDARDVLERASARETAARVAAGALAKALLAELGVTVVSHVVAIGGAASKAVERPGPQDLERVDASEVRCFDPGAEAAMVDEIKAASRDGDSLGGVVEVIAYGVPVGLGSHVHWDRKIDGLLAGALMSIHAVKGVEIGDGFALARVRGSATHDEIEPGLRRRSNRAGGLEAGVTNGEELVVRAAMKPLPTLMKPLDSVDLASGEPAQALVERSDVAAVEALAVVAEAAVAWEIARAAREKFGGDALVDFTAAHAAYLERIRTR